MNFKSINVLLNDVDKIKNFVRIASSFDVDIDICYGRYVIDAKSIMGVLSLDTSKFVKLTMHTDSDEVFEMLKEKLNMLKIVVE